MRSPLRCMRSELQGFRFRPEGAKSRRQGVGSRVPGMRSESGCERYRVEGERPDRESTDSGWLGERSRLASMHEARRSEPSGAERVVFPFISTKPGWLGMPTEVEGEQVQGTSMRSRPSGEPSRCAGKASQPPSKVRSGARGVSRSSSKDSARGCDAPALAGDLSRSMSVLSRGQFIGADR